MFDLDGGLWQPRDLDLAVTTPPPGVNSPNDEGMMTLLSRDLASSRAAWAARLLWFAARGPWRCKAVQDSLDQG